MVYKSCLWLNIYPPPFLSACVDLILWIHWIAIYLKGRLLWLRLWIAFANGIKNRYFLPCHGSSEKFSARHEFPLMELALSPSQQQLVTSWTGVSLMCKNDLFCSCIGWSLLETLYSSQCPLEHFECHLCRNEWRVFVYITVWNGCNNIS